MAKAPAQPIFIETRAGTSQRSRGRRRALTTSGCDRFRLGQRVQQHTEVAPGTLHRAPRVTFCLVRGTCAP